VLAVVGCAGRPGIEAPEPAPVLVVAVDALDLDTVRSLAREGRLPTFGRLLGEGALAELDTDRPAEPTVVWGELATGVGWERNGLYQERVPSREGDWLTGEEALAVPPLWEEGGGFCWGWFRPVVRMPGESPWDYDDASAAVVREREEGLRLVRLRHPGGMALMHWDAHLAALETPGSADPIAEAYVQLDRQVGSLLASLDETGTMILVSSSSVEPLVPPRALVLDMERLLQRLGLLAFVAGREDRGNREVDRSRSRLVPLSAGQGWPHYPRPRFLAVAGVDAGGDAGERQRTRRGLAWVLRQVRTVDSGTPLFSSVKVWDGRTAPAALAPDLVAAPSEEALLEDVVVRGSLEIPLFDELVYRYDLPTGSAEAPGWVLAVGPALRPGKGGPVRPMDLAPLVVYLRGRVPPLHMEGILPSWLLRRPPDDRTGP